MRDLGEVKGGIVTFEIEGMDPEETSKLLRNKGINTSASGIASTRFDMEARGIQQLTRTSTHYFTTDEEIDLLCSSIEEIIRA